MILPFRQWLGQKSRTKNITAELQRLLRKEKTKEGAARSRLWGRHLTLRGVLCGLRKLCGDIRLCTV
jgi:hypothetical protein